MICIDWGLGVKQFKDKLDIFDGIQLLLHQQNQEQYEGAQK